MSGASSSATAEMDNLLKKAVRLLHSTHPQSATELRMMIDDLLKQRYGPENMLCNILSQRELDLEKNFPGMVKSPQQTTQEPETVINLTNSPEKTIADSDDEKEGITTVISGNEDFGDLNCCVCAEMMFTASNRLIECSKCGSLYHQECHKPKITDEEASDQEHTWQCDTCFNKPSTSRAATTIIVADDSMPLCSKAESGTTSPTSSISNSSIPPVYRKESPVISLANKTTKNTSKTQSSNISLPVEPTFEKQIKSKSHSASSKSISKFSKHDSSHKRKSSK